MSTRSRQFVNRVLAMVMSLSLALGMAPSPALADEAPAEPAEAIVAPADAPEAPAADGSVEEACGAAAVTPSEPAEAPVQEALQEEVAPDDEGDEPEAAALQSEATMDAAQADGAAGSIAEEKAEVAEPAEAGYPAFKQSAKVDGVTVTVEADAGAFPEGARLSVAAMPSSATETAVAPERGTDQNVAASYTFDIKVLDKDGAELQPADGKSVRVSFAAAEVADPNLDVSVYHVSGGAAEELVVTESGTTATATSDGFSYYTVEFTYGDLQYVLPGGESIQLSEILAAVGLQGEPEAVEVSDPELFSASDETGAWVVTSHRAFSSDEWMRVTIAGKPYVIAVTDAQTNNDDGTWTFSIDGENATIEDYNGNKTEISIPGTVKYEGKDYAVTSIGDSAFNECASLQSVEIPNSVTSIEANAFYGCSSLQSVDIPESVTNIGSAAFFKCSNLASVKIPNSVTYIETNTFCGCSSLSSVDIPNSVTSIGINAFRGCSSLQSVEIPESVTSIGTNAFYECSSLQSVDIPERVTNIGTNAFMDCSSLQSVEISSGVTSIGERMFLRCSSLQSVDIPESVTSIGTKAFQNCSSLATVTMTRGEQDLVLGEGAFEGAKAQSAKLEWAGGGAPEGYTVSFGITPGGAGYNVSGSTLSWSGSTGSATLSAKLKRDITITAASQTWPYDGKEHKNTEVTVTEGELLPGDELVAVASGSVTNVADTAEGNNKIAAGYKIMRDTEDVTDEYAITPVAGTLTITKAPLTITVFDQNYVYNGYQQGEGDTTYNDSAMIDKKVAVEGLKGSDKLTIITLDGERTDIGVYGGEIKITGCSIGEEGSLTRNYEITTVPGTLSILQPTATVTITGNADTATYDGKEHSVEGYKVVKIESNDGKYTADDFTGPAQEDAVAKGTDAGKYSMGLAGKFTNNNDRYNVTFKVTDGSITIERRTVTVEVAGNTDTKAYSGEEQKVEGYEVEVSDKLYTKDDFTFSGEAIAKGTDVNTDPGYAMGLAKDQFKNDNDNFDVTFVVASDGWLKVTKASVAVTITGNSDSKPYSGGEQKVEGYGVSIDNKLYTERDFTFFGEAVAKATSVGIAHMGLSATDFKNANGNFDVTFNVTDGELEITKRALTIIADSDSKAYDGTPLSKDSYTSEGLADGDSIESVTVTGSQTVAGTSDNVPSAAKVVNSAGKDVTSNYEVAYVNGTLEVTQKSVTVTAGSDSKAYDGTPLTKDSFTNTELAEGDRMVSVTVTGSQTVAGTSDNVPSAAKISNAAGEDVTASYDITYEKGTLEVTKAPVTVTITGNKESKAYTGKELSVEGYTFSTDNELYKETDFRFSGDAVAKGTEAGTYPMGLAADQFANTNGNFDVTFEVTDGELEVYAWEATLTFDLAGGTLDGRTGKVVIKATTGRTIKLPKAPTREGYTFKCWRGSEYAAGAAYKVEGDHAFTAEWVVEEGGRKLPQTGDLVAMAPTLPAALGSLSLIAGAVSRRRRRS